ncbi:hypothetical protein CHUAL_013830 [Chamberlinius hualienensis]
MGYEKYDCVSLLLRNHFGEAVVKIEKCLMKEIQPIYFISSQYVRPPSCRRFTFKPKFGAIGELIATKLSWESHCYKYY